jgi:hypothetical protein
MPEVAMQLPRLPIGVDQAVELAGDDDDGHRQLALPRAAVWTLVSIVH